jgi:hypothetical protein
MARIVLGLGTSHSPLLSLDGSRWAERAADDLRSRSLNTSDGRWLTYDQLRAEVGDRYASVSTREHFIAKAAICQSALDRLAAELAAAAPDIVVIIGDDQGELFSLSNMPAVSIFYGDKIVTRPRRIDASSPSWLPTVAKGYAMDQAHAFQGAPAFALDLIERLISNEVDVGAAARVDDPQQAGFGHAYGFVARRLFGDKPIPIVKDEVYWLALLSAGGTMVVRVVSSCPPPAIRRYTTSSVTGLPGVFNGSGPGQECNASAYLGR